MLITGTSFVPVTIIGTALVEEWRGTRRRAARHNIDPWEIERFLAEVAAGRTAGEPSKPARRTLEYRGELRHVNRFITVCASLIAASVPRVARSVPSLNWSSSKTQ
ncbi:hypothetical protein [Actinoplanes campanulatus]|uniref:hypothetical protein n=1 Tax=Actinoplanes campanulatus TaxID=113559 RepID=UPI0019546F5C|nr:hypothetical protein [Actinoplanes capillaceus]